MTDYFDQHGVQYRLGRQIGAGGEGSVFEILGHTALVAKIFHQPLGLEADEKLQALTRVAGDSLRRSAALPLALLTLGRSGPTAGLTMPAVRGFDEIHTLYSPAHRKVRYPDKDWAFLIHVAMNLTAAFHVIHESDLVIADVNQGNVLVSPRGTVCLIDCDSFQLRHSGRIYPCDVGVGHFTPPELQGRSFRGLIRTPNHDRFGLAILIFHLLCMGRHPYAGRMQGSGEPPGIEAAISDYDYAYARSPGRVLQPPPLALIPYQVLPRISALFDRAFLPGSERPTARPDEEEWYDALAELKSQLKPCPIDVGHKYPNTLGNCPWCALERDGSVNLFASVTAHLARQREGELAAGVEDLWEPLKELERQSRLIELPRPAPAPNANAGLPVPAPVEQNEAFGLLLVQSACVCTLGLIALWPWWPAPIILGVLAVGFVIWGLFVRAISGRRAESRRRRKRLAESAQRLQNIERDAATHVDIARQEFLRWYRMLDLTRSEIEGLRQRYEQELDQFLLQRERRQLESFLQTHWIRDARIPQIDDARKAILLSFGVETALDLNEIRLLNIDGLDPLYVSALMDWKRSVQQQFRFRPRESISDVDRNTVLARYLRQREELESTLQSGQSTLEVLLETQRAVTLRLTQQRDAALSEARLAEADVRALRNLAKTEKLP